MLPNLGGIGSLIEGLEEFKKIAEKEFGGFGGMSKAIVSLSRLLKLIEKEFGSVDAFVSEVKRHGENKGRIGHERDSK